MSSTKAAPPEAPEVRQFQSVFEFRSLDTSNRTMTARVAPYGVKSDLITFTETLRRGVFAKSIRESARALPLHVNHRHDDIPVGKVVQWTETSDWLLADVQFDSRAEAREAARLVEEDYLSGISIGFLPIQTAWDTSGSKPHAERVEARALELSLCSVPGYEGSRVLALRSMGCPEVPETAVVATPRLHEARAWLEQIRQR